MSAYELSGNPPVPLILRRSGRARRITLRISRLDGRVTLTLPNGVTEAEALAFAESKEAWIRSHLDTRPELVHIAPGCTIPVEGIPRRIVFGSGRRVVADGETIAVPSQSAGRRLQSWLKELARDRLSEAADAYAAQLGRRYSRITLRDTRSRWGSCTSDGGLMFSWRLILAPPDVLRYVAAHEVAHLEQMNHSAAFWFAVERLYGAYEAPRRWLRTEGTALHRYRFEN